MRRALLILGGLLAVAGQAHGASCSTPSLATGDPFGGSCSLSCGPDTSSGTVIAEGVKMGVLMSCANGHVRSCSPGSVDLNPLRCEASYLNEAWGTTVTCTCSAIVGRLETGEPAGIVLGGSCSC